MKYSKLVAVELRPQAIETLYFIFFSRSRNGCAIKKLCIHWCFQCHVSTYSSAREESAILVQTAYKDDTFVLLVHELKNRRTFAGH